MKNKEILSYILNVISARAMFKDISELLSWTRIQYDIATVDLTTGAGYRRPVINREGKLKDSLEGIKKGLGYLLDKRVRKSERILTKAESVILVSLTWEKD